MTLSIHLSGITGVLRHTCLNIPCFTKSISLYKFTFEMNLYLNLDLDVVFFQASLYLLNSYCQAGIKVMQMREEHKRST